MKLLSIIVITLTISACGMQIEEYNARVKYCETKGMKTKIWYYSKSKKIYGIECINSDGHVFDSKVSK